MFKHDFVHGQDCPQKALWIVDPIALCHLEISLLHMKANLWLVMVATGSIAGNESLTYRGLRVNNSTGIIK